MKEDGLFDKIFNHIFDFMVCGNIFLLIFYILIFFSFLYIILKFLFGIDYIL